MLQILYSSGGLKMGLKIPFEIRIVTKFSAFYGIILTNLRIFLSAGRFRTF